MSPCINTDSTFLETKLKPSNGEMHNVPQIILNSVRPRVVDQCLGILKTNFHFVASGRSYIRIAEAIEPSIRKENKVPGLFCTDLTKRKDVLKNLVHIQAVSKTNI